MAFPTKEVRKLETALVCSTLSSFELVNCMKLFLLCVNVFHTGLLRQISQWRLQLRIGECFAGPPEFVSTGRQAPAPSNCHLVKMKSALIPLSHGCDLTQRLYDSKRWIDVA
jgi:hypothetical protein